MTAHPTDKPSSRSVDRAATDTSQSGEVVTQPEVDVYHRFIEEFDALTIRADDPAAHVVGVLFRACKRAQMVHDGDLAPVRERRQTSDEAAGVTFTLRDGRPTQA